jgi:hypothetical protein
MYTILILYILHHINKTTRQLLTVANINTTTQHHASLGNKQYRCISTAFKGQLQLLPITPALPPTFPHNLQSSRRKISQHTQSRPLEACRIRHTNKQCEESSSSSSIPYTGNKYNHHSTPADSITTPHKAQQRQHSNSNHYRSTPQKNTLSLPKTQKHPTNYSHPVH